MGNSQARARARARAVTGHVVCVMLAKQLTGDHFLMAEKYFLLYT